MDGWEDEEEKDEGFRTYETPKKKPSIGGWKEMNDDENFTNDDTGGGGGWGEDDEDSKFDFASLSVTTPKNTLPASSSMSQAPSDDLLIDWNEPASPQPAQSTLVRQQDDSWTSWGEDTSLVKPKPKPSTDSWNRGSQQLRSSKASSLSPALSGKSSLGLKLDTKVSSGGSGAWQRTPAASNEGDFFEEMLGSMSSKSSSIASLARHSPAVRSNVIASAVKKAAAPTVSKEINEEDEGNGWDAW